jgi:hypothetical protein
MLIKCFLAYEDFSRKNSHLFSCLGIIQDAFQKEVGLLKKKIHITSVHKHSQALS